MRTQDGNTHLNGNLRLRVRLDFRGGSRPARFFFGGKSTEKVAEELREQKIAQLRNIPIQGVSIEDMDMSLEIYMVNDDITGEEVAYAPVILTIKADSIEDVIRFTMREEFRKVEILEPEQMDISRHDIERFLFKMNEELHAYRMLWEKRLQNK